MMLFLIVFFCTQVHHSQAQDRPCLSRRATNLQPFPALGGNALPVNFEQRANGLAGFKSRGASKSLTEGFRLLSLRK